ncbi:MAG: hypothetical protein NTX50_30645 [Candidatus Sumerlaeota bacterium]|nr:hypothetical protein [Candidatus Sumerlaeota bacterium]
MPNTLDKSEVHHLIDRLPNTATYDDLMQEIYEIQAIKEGLADSEAGRTNDVREIRKKYGLAT